MKQKFLIRYLILMGVLVLCAAAAWFVTNASAQPEENAVLADCETFWDAELYEDWEGEAA